jgi:lysozyme family protein
MTAANFAECTKWLLVHEGGYVNHPKDPGGPTNKGVTQRVYDAYRSRSGLDRRSVREITDKEVYDIYRNNYWDRVNGDHLPAGLDYSMYDYSVNSGVSRAVKALQGLLRVKVDGIMGDITLSAIKAKNDIEGLIKDLNEQRWAWLKTLKTYSTFGKGWTARVMGNVPGAQPGEDTGVIDRSIWLFQGQTNIPAPKMAAQGKALEEDVKTSKKALDSINLDNVSKIGSGVLPGAIGSAAALPAGPLQWAAAAVAVIAAITLAWVVIHKFTSVAK